MTTEFNFDGLVGPTHNYAGLAYGNLAATSNAAQTSHPKRAALQGLTKMRRLSSLGIPQGVLPPQDRPSIYTLRQLGFEGSDTEVLAAAASRSPRLLQTVSSGAAMWVANAATVSPSADTKDSKVHFTPANLSTQLHRSIEAPTTARALKATFPDSQHFVHHAAIPSALGDEGAANHTRFASTYGEHGTHFFVYGRSAFGGEVPTTYPARQTREASEAVALQHGLDQTRVVFARQNPSVIDQGAFHNDVISVGDRDLLFHHEEAFADLAQLEELQEREPHMSVVSVPNSVVSVAQAVSSYLFNSQIVSAGGRRVLVAPDDIRMVPDLIDYLKSLGIFDELIMFDLRESMQNGGGPACLRLRVVLAPEELQATNRGSLWSDDLDQSLVSWVERHYRDDLTPADLGDPALIHESRTALQELTEIMGLGPIYDFQR